MGLNRGGGVTLPYSERTDHKHVTLYGELNKRVGPMSLSNAEATMIRWAKSGFNLYTQPRTEEQMAAYKLTPKYQIEHKKWLDKQEVKKKFAKMSPEELTRLTAVEVGKAVAGEMSKITEEKAEKKTRTKKVKADVVS